MEDSNLKYVRPTTDESIPVTVTMGISLSQLVLLDAKNQILTTNMFIRQVWHNPYLQWNASKYGGIKTINLSPEQMWLPDITLYNNAEGDNAFGGSMDKLSTRVIIDHTGKCTWLSPAMVVSKCNIDIRYFPFDTQKCNLKFGSWTYDGGRLDLRAEATEADLSKYTDNAEWKLMNMTANRNVVKYICCKELYPDITYTMTIKRRSLFYLVNLIVPLVMISALACMTFMVPFESGERVSLSITVLLSMTVFMLLVQEMIPPTSDNVPLVAKFYTATMIEMGIGVVIACYNLHLYFIDPQFYKMPRWMKTIVLGHLSYLVGVKTSKELEECPTQSTSSFDEINEHGTPAVENNNKLQSTTTLNYLEDVMDYGIEENNYQWEYEPELQSLTEKSWPLKTAIRPTLKRQASVDSTKLQRQPYEDDIANVNFCEMINHRSPARARANTQIDEELVSIVRSQYDEKMNEQKYKNDKLAWRQAAMIFDRLFFYMFLGIFGITAAWVFSEAPGYVD